MAEVNLVLDGDPGEITAEAFSAALSHLIKLIRLVGGGADAAPVMTGLAMGSVSATLDTEKAVANRVNRGIAQLRNTPEIPPGWHHKTLRELDYLGHIGTDRHSDGITGVNLSIEDEIVHLDTELARDIQEVSISITQAFTTIRGRLLAYSHKTNEDSCYVMIQPQGGAPAVRVNIPDILEGTAIRLIEKRVEVLGLGTRDDGVTLKTIDAQRIEAMSDSIPELSVDDIIGSWETAPGVVPDSVHLVREVRDAWQKAPCYVLNTSLLIALFLKETGRVYRSREVLTSDADLVLPSLVVLEILANPKLRVAHNPARALLFVQLWIIRVGIFGGVAHVALRLGLVGFMRCHLNCRHRCKSRLAKCPWTSDKSFKSLCPDSPISTTAVSRYMMEREAK